jgi:hypothetical protein
MYSYSGKLEGSAAMFEEDFVLVFTNAREFLKFSTYNSNIKVALIWQYFIDHISAEMMCGCEKRAFSLV